MVELKTINGCKKGDNKSFRLLYEATIPYCYSIVKRYVVQSEIEDVVQECYAALFTSIKRYNPKKAEFKFFFRGLIVNNCLKVLRKEKKNIILTPLNEELTKDSIDSELILQTNQLNIKEIENILTDMPEGYKLVFMLFVFEDYSHKEIASLLEITPETSRSQYMRAKKWILKNTNLTAKSNHYG